MSEYYLDLARVHAPLITLVAMFLGAAMAAAVANGRLSWAIAVLAALAAAAAASELTVLLVLGHALPAEAAGVALALDGVGAFTTPLIAALAVLALLAFGAALPRERSASHIVALILSAGGGWVGAILAKDMIGCVVAAQVAWLASVAAVALSSDRERGSLNGALRMWAAGGVGAAMMLLGLAMILRGVGSGDVAAIASVHVGAPQLATIGFVLVMLPLCLFAGVAPLHGWVGAAYGRADGGVAIAIGTIGTIGALAVLTRIAAHVASGPAVADGVAAALVVSGAASVAIGSVQAVGAANVRRLVAYATATQGGCVLIAIALGSPAGFASALVQMFALGAAALAILGGAAAVKGADLAALDGLGRRAPLAGAAITAGALSLMGAPLTVGFLGRWRLIEASVGAGWWWATGAAIAASLAAVFYGGRLIERIYFRRATDAHDLDRDAWRFVRAPVLIMAVAAIGWGLAPAALLQAASQAAMLALEHTP